MPIDFIAEDEATLDFQPEAGAIDFQPETVSTAQGLVNAGRRGVIGAQAAGPTVAAALMGPRQGPTMRQGFRAFQGAMDDPAYLDALMAAGGDPAREQRAESMLGPTARAREGAANASAVRDIWRGVAADFQKERGAIPQSAAQQALGVAQGPGGKWGVFKQYPAQTVASVVLESLPPALAGAAVGSAGGPAGVAAGAGLASGAMEFSHEFLGEAQRAGFDPADAAQLGAFIDSPAYDGAVAKALTRASIVAGVDTATAGFAGTLIKPALRDGLRKVIPAVAKEGLVQAAGGSGGEFLAQAATKAPGAGFDWFDIGLEALAEVATLPGEVGAKLVTERGGIDFQPEAGAPSPGASQAAPAVPGGGSVLRADTGIIPGTEAPPGPPTVPAELTPDVLADLQSVMRGEKPESERIRRPSAIGNRPSPIPKENFPGEAEGDARVREMLQDRTKNYAGMSAFELEWLEANGDVGARSARKERQVAKWREGQAPAVEPPSRRDAEEGIRPELSRPELSSQEAATPSAPPRLRGEESPPIDFQPEKETPRKTVLRAVKPAEQMAETQEQRQSRDDARRRAVERAMRAIGVPENQVQGNDARLTAQWLPKLKEYLQRPESGSAPKASLAEPGAAQVNRAQIEAEVERFRAELPGSPKVRIAANSYEVPGALWEGLRKKSQAGARAEAVYWNGEIWLFQDAFRTADRVRAVLAHEILGHHGLRAVLGAELNPFLEAVAQRYEGTAAWREIESLYGRDRLTNAEEIVARVAEGGITDAALWRRVVAAVKAAWRKLTGGAISEDEIRALLAQARARLRGNGERGTGSAEPMFALADTKRFPQYMPERLQEMIRGWDYVSKSPYSDSYYNKPGKSWDHTPEGSLRVADHWNFTTDFDGRTHARTDKPVPHGAWAVGQYENGTYKILEFWPRDWKREALDDVLRLASPGHRHLVNVTHTRGLIEQYIRQNGLEIEPPRNSKDFRRVAEEATRLLNATASPEAGGAGIKTPLETPPRRPEGQADKGNVSAWRTEEASALTEQSKSESSASVNPSDNLRPTGGAEPRFSLSPADRNARGAELSAEARRLREAIRATHHAELKADLQDELDAVSAEMDELITSAPKPRGGIPKAATGIAKPSAPPAARGPVSVTAIVQDKARRVSSATQRQGKTVSEWWDGVKLFFRHFAVQVPEIPIFGQLASDQPAQFAEKFRRGIRLTVPATNAALDKAREAVENVVKPLMDLGRATTDPNTVARYNEMGTKIEKERLRGDRMRANRIDAWNAEQAKLEEQLAGNPWWLYQQAVLWRDLWWRGSHLKDKWGRPIKLPGELTEEDALALSQLTDQRIAASPHADAIRESLKRHYALMDELHTSLREHGEIIPENMQNPLYFPHQVLDYYTAKIDAVRPTTEEPFRSYLINPVGSEKLVMADYLASVYKHAAEIYAHNAQVDIAETYVQPYDIGAKVQANLAAEAEASGDPAPDADAFTWERNIPAGYVAFKPYKLTPLRPELVIDRRKLAEGLGVELGSGDLLRALKEAGIEAQITPDMIIEAYVKGAREVTWLLPEEIAAAITGIQKRMDNARARTIGRLVGLPFEGLQRGWKYNILFNPINWTRYERNNLTSDVLKMAAADPGMFKYLKRAAREIRVANTANGSTTPELASAMKEGVLDTVTAGEAGDLAVLKDFEAFQPDAVRRREWLKRLATATTRGSAFREGVFRYAKFLADLERLRRGEKPEYGGAYAPDIEALTSPVAKAAEISLKNFGDYSALSPAGRWLRRYLFPFFSWTEVNFRYHANLTRNLVDAVREGRKGGRDVARVAGAQATMVGVQALRIVVTLAAIRLAFEAWNQFGGPLLGLWEWDDDLEKTLSEADRRKLHLILGKDANGKTRVLQVADALGDVLQYFGGNNFARLGMEWARGQITLGQWASDSAKQMPVDTLNAFAQQLRPEGKAAYIALTGQSLFPDVTKQRNVSRHDLTWNILSEMTDRSGVMGLRALLDKDHYAPQSLGEWMQQQVLGVRRRDPEAWGYFEIKDRAADWYEDKTGKHSAGDWQSPDQVVLRNFRKAVYRGDVENATRFYHRALELGYTAERFRASLQNQDPLAVIPDKANRAEFVAQLSQYEKDLLSQALRYYSRLAASRGREAGLFPRGRPRPDFPPQDARLQDIMRRREEMPAAELDEMTRQLMRRSTAPARR